MSDAQERFAGRQWKNWTVPTLVDVDGVPTAYRRAGEGPVVLSLHGSEETRVWSPLHAALAGSFDVIAPEHPGMGDTVADERFEDWVDYVLHYDAFLRAVDATGPIHLVGTDLGAWLAAHLASFYPERFASLTLVTPYGVYAPEDPFIDRFRMNPPEQFARLFNGREDRHLADLAQEGEIDDAVRAYADLTTVALLTWNPRYERRFDTRLSRVRTPSLVIGAEDDRLVGTGQAARFADLLPSSTLATIPGPDGEPSSHGLAIEQPADVATTIADFIATTR